MVELFFNPLCEKVTEGPIHNRVRWDWRKESHNVTLAEYPK